MMSFREQLTQMRREYRKDAERLDKRLEEQTKKTDKQFEIVELQMQALRDQLAATGEAIHQLRADHQEVTRTLQGRARLMEDRFGKMLDLVESNQIEPSLFVELQRRVEALEQRDNPAA